MEMLQSYELFMITWFLEKNIQQRGKVKSK
jgi:hypothetical protein